MDDLILLVLGLMVILVLMIPVLQCSPTRMARLASNVITVVVSIVTGGIFLLLLIP